MRCNEFDLRFHELLDARVDVTMDATLAAHAASCGDCQRRLSAHAELMAGLDLRTLPPMRADFADRVWSATKSPHRTHRRRVAVSVALATAAVVLIVALPQWLTSPAPPPSVPAEVAPGAAGIHHGKFAAANADSRNSSDDYLAVFRYTGAAMAMLPGTVRRATAPESNPLAQPIRTVSVSVSAALDALRRTLPSKASDTTAPSGTTNAPTDSDAGLLSGNVPLSVSW